MRKFFTLIAFFFLVFSMPSTHSAAIVNEVVASVGSIAITSLDIQRMREFEEIIYQKKPSASQALEKLITLSSLLIIAEGNPAYYTDESELRQTITSLTNNPSDPRSPQLKQIYETYSDMYRLLLRSEKVKKGLMYSEPFIREAINHTVPEKESRAFYNQHKAQFMDSPFPKFDLVIFAVEASPRWTLSQLETVETSMQDLADELSKSTDYKELRRKYASKLKFTSYSGVTGLFTPDVLILQKKIPDEVLGIAIQPSIDLGTSKIVIKKDKGIFIPQPIPFKSTGIPTYLTLKVLQIEQPKQLSYDVALPRVEEIIKIQRAEKAIEQLIKMRIKEGQITLTASDEKSPYSKVFNSFK